MNSVEQSAGHRKRLRERFLKGGLAGFADYEIAELFLSLGTPRKDVKAEAKEALKLFKTLRGVLSATPEELQQITGIGPHSVFGILLIQAVAREFLKEKIWISTSINPPRKFSITSTTPCMTSRKKSSRLST